MPPESTASELAMPPESTARELAVGSHSMPGGTAEGRPDSSLPVEFES